MLQRLVEWSNRIQFSDAAHAPLGFGFEYWDLDPTHYEGWQQLEARLAELGRRSTRRGLAYDLASHLLDDVVAAAGGVESAIGRLRAAVAELTNYADEHGIRAKNDIPMGLGHPASTDAWYAFADLLAWSRAVVERLDRPAGDRRRFPRQGLVPAIKPKRLKKRCEALLAELRRGPVGQSRFFANFMLHSALVRHPFSGVAVDSSGTVRLPIPDIPDHPVNHWYLLRWSDERDGLPYSEQLWETIQGFVDELLQAFERAVPRRLRKD